MIDRRSARRRQTGETGAILPFLALGFLAISLFLIMTVDLGVGYNARGQLQNIADAAARAALEMRTDNGMSPGEAITAATNFAQRMQAANGLPGADVVFGDYDFASNTFRPGGMELNPAVRVVASRMAQGGGGRAIPGLLGDMDVSASSTAMFKCRAIVLVEDVSASFGPGIPGSPAGNEIEQAKAGLQQLVNAMAQQALPGDHIGLVAFDNDAETLLDLTPLPRAQPLLSGPGGLISSLQACASLECDGTNQAAGINLAIDMFAANDASICNGVLDRLMIVISDGQPCGANTQALRAAATAAVARADNADISVASIFFDRGTDSCFAEPDAVGMSPVAFSQSLITGDLGRSFVTPSAREIGNLLLDILKLFRVSVVG